MTATRLTLTVVAGVIVLFVTFTILIWRLGLGTFAGSEGQAKVIVAGLTLLGGFLAAVITLVGVLIRASLDERAEGRLKLEAGTRAVQLLVTADGQLSSLSQRGGALYLLSSLGFHELTLALTADLLSRGEVEPHTAASVLDMALTSGQAAIQAAAIDIVYDHASHFLTPTGYELPESINAGCANLPPFVRSWAASALGRLMIARPLREWATLRFAGHSILGTLAIAWQNEKEPRIRQNFGGIFASLRPQFPQIPDVLYSPQGDINILKATQETRDVEPWTDAAAYLVEQINAWTRD
jgi:hypothetical protein